MPFEIVRNDITRMPTDAIVNAANHSLLGGGGVDGAIHRAAGPELLAECETLNGCETGKAKITKGYRLPCKYVIHTVGPVWQGGDSGEKELLASCYRESLTLAEKYGCESVAFPLISSGAYGYPKEQALQVAEKTIREFLENHDMRVILVIFDRRSYAISRELYSDIQAYIDDAYIGPDYDRLEKARRLQNTFPCAEMQAPEQDARRKDAPAYPPAGGEKAESLHGAPAPKMEDACFIGMPGLSEYLAGIDEGFRDMLLRKIDERHMTDAECYKKANIDRKLFNKIKNQPDYRPGKSTVVALAVALELSLEETKDMLSKAGFSLSHSSKFDLIVEYFIRMGNYDIYQINEALFAFDQKLLGSLA